MKRSLLAISCGLLLGTACLAKPANHSHKVKKETVTIENMKFNPDHLVAHAGDEIVWVNKDLVPHTATATNKAFDSKLIAPGSSWKFKIQKSGAVNYGCAFHPAMKASIVVK